MGHYYDNFCEYEGEGMEYMLSASEITLGDRDGEPWESKMGGCPYLRSKEEYPIGQNGKPMLFLAQINLKDIQNIPELPEQGLLQFFVEWIPAKYHYGIGFPPVVRWIEQVEESREGLLLEHPYEDQAYLDALPYSGGGNLLFAEIPEAEEGEPMENSQVGGYPCYMQEGEMLPSEIMLLQLADQSGCPTHFGDCGICHFFMEREALARRDFSDIRYDWDCC